MDHSSYDPASRPATTSHEPGDHPLSQTTEIEDASDRAYNTLANYWSIGGHESAAPATPRVDQIDKRAQASHISQYWPTHQAQPVFANQYNTFGGSFHSPFHHSFDNALTEQAPTDHPPPISIPFSHWGDNESGAPPSARHQLQSVHPCMTLPTRAKPIRPGKFRSYRTSRTHAINPKEVPATPVPPWIKHDGLPMLRVSGGLSETTVDAESTPKNTEINNDPERVKQKRAPRCKGKPRPYRAQMMVTSLRLRNWVKEKRNRTTYPTFVLALKVAVEEIQKIREMKTEEPTLLTGRPSQTKAPSWSASYERGRRTVVRKLFQQLSQYYPRAENQGPWSSSQLLSVVVKDLEESNENIGPYDETPLSPSP